MNLLGYEQLQKQKYDGHLLQQAPERFLQFGEGNFLRAFVDYFIDIVNEITDIKSKVVVVQPIATGLVDILNEQDGLYTLYLRGMKDGKKIEEKRIISSISRGINPYEQFDDFLNCAKNPHLRYILSNTTEAGIIFDETCPFDLTADTCPSSFPAKLTRLLYARYQAFGTEKDRGFVMLPCELIAQNGEELRRCVVAYIRLWGLEAAFAEWVSRENIFCSTLVDRIVTGYPATQADALNEKNGYEDRLLNTGEVFGLWVIEGPASLSKELPFSQAGLPVKIVDDHTPYKQRKVRILNGAHTSMVLAAYLSGKDIVRDCMEDEVIRLFMETAINQEIKPTIDLPPEELDAFALSVTERFQNPFIDHKLLSIALNSTSKWRARVLPTIKDYLEKYETLPTCLVFSFAAYVTFYRGTCLNGQELLGQRGEEDYCIVDERPVLSFFEAHRDEDSSVLVDELCSFDSFWGENLTEIHGFTDCVKKQLDIIKQKGMYQAMQQILQA